ncbi:3-oxoacyl-ACP synthase III family protein [Bergeyella zoohelcum]|uniref:3-oxoacyl-ACP synthase III family protein n=1 Tax=Bergeyella zoohelcum TaxID=1015 RepID=UPI002A91C64F|nr:3-oxoacyl-ACP synthase III family protein [Bergeyella zoohelcum]MDY6026438.1 3-oxoacyl-ACP synthase III family protein [Bergeyella zoohelcum]
MANTIIIGSGCYLPERIIGRDYFYSTQFFDEQFAPIDKPAEEIVSKFVEITEIENRRYINDHQTNSEIGAIAAKLAIEDAGIDPETLDYIIFATNFGELTKDGRSDFMPTLAARVKKKLGIKNRKCVTYDMIFGCPGWVEGMILANQLIKAGSAKRILVIGSETLSRATDPYDRNKMIFADGSGAVVVEATEDESVGIIAHNTLCDNDAELCYLENNHSLNPDENPSALYIRMQGRKIYEYALKNVPDAMKNTIEDAGLGIDDIDKILLHQANAKMDHAIIDRLMRLYGIRKYDHAIAPMTIQEFGNSSVATIPTMFDLIIKGKMEGQQFKDKGNVLMASVGAGMNINAFVYRFP